MRGGYAEAMENGAGISQEGMVAQERFCIGCGYNLRTLRREGICPECGKAVAASLRPTLYAADARWLRSIRWGMWLMMSHVVVVIAAEVVGKLLPRQWQVVPYLIAPVGPKLVMLLAGPASPRSWTHALAALAMMLYALGVFAFTSSAADETQRARATALWLRIVGMTVALLEIGVVGLAIPWSFRLLDREGLVFLAFAEMVVIPLTYARFVHLAEFAEARMLAMHTRWLWIAHLTTMLLVLLSLTEDKVFVFAMLLLGLVCAVGFVLWGNYVRLINAALRRG